MQNNMKSTETSNTEVCVLEQLEPTPPNSSDNIGVINRPHHLPPFGVALTAYRLLTTSVILGLGIPKAVCSYRGRSLIATTFDGMVGTIFGLILFWLAMFDAKHPEFFPRFFQADLAPPILRFISRHAGFLCFPSFASVPHATKHLHAVLDPIWDEDHAYKITADLITVELVSAVLGFGVSIWVFFSLCWRVVRRKGLEDHDFLLQSSVLMLTVCAVYLMIMFCLSKLRDWYQLHPIPTAAMADFPSISINFALILFLYGPGSDVREAGEDLVLIGVVVTFLVGNWYLGISRGKS